MASQRRFPCDRFIVPLSSFDEISAQKHSLNRTCFFAPEKWIRVGIRKTYSSCKGFGPSVFFWMVQLLGFRECNIIFLRIFIVDVFKILSQIQGAQFCFSPIWSGLVSPELVGPSYLECFPESRRKYSVKSVKLTGSFTNLKIVGVGGRGSYRYL